MLWFVAKALSWIISAFVNESSGPSASEWMDIILLGNPEGIKPPRKFIQPPRCRRHRTISSSRISALDECRGIQNHVARCDDMHFEFTAKLIRRSPKGIPNRNIL